VRLNVLRGTLLPRPHAVHDYLYSERTRQSNKPTHARADGRENVEADVGLREGEGDERRLGFSISKLTQTRCAWVWCSVQARTRKVKVKFETKNSHTHTAPASELLRNLISRNLHRVVLVVDLREINIYSFRLADSPCYRRRTPTTSSSSPGHEIRTSKKGFRAENSSIFFHLAINFPLQAALRLLFLFHEYLNSTVNDSLGKARSEDEKILGGDFHV
jgi:hypothetical protein